MNHSISLNHRPLDDKAPIPFNILSKAAGSNCNLACKYCYYPQDTHTAGVMSDSLLESFIQIYIKQFPSYAQTINFVWQGGEPTLAGLDFYKKVIFFQKKYIPDGIEVVNSLQTNGTLLNDEWGSFLKAHNFIVGISLDGYKVLNDLHRVSKKGEGSHSSAINGLNILKKFQVEFNVLVVVHDGMIDKAQEIYDYFSSIGVSYLQFQPLTSEGRASSGGYSLGATGWGRFLKDIYYYWKQKKDEGSIYILNIENAYAQYFNHFSPTCVHSQVCGNQLALESDGKLYACDHLINEGYYIGNLAEKKDLLAPLYKSVMMDFGKNKSNRKECIECRVKLLCEGGCPAHLNSQGKNQLCEGYYQFFSVILDEVEKYPRDPSGVSAWRLK